MKQENTKTAEFYNNYTIYIIEDDKNIAELLEFALKNTYNILKFEKGEDAINTLNKIPADLIICDIMLPTLDGIEIVSKIRAIKNFKTTPIIIITAKDSEIDKIKGLDAGADDYITKPFSVIELMARIRAQFRKMENYKNNVDNIDKDKHISVGLLCLDLLNREVFVAGESISLTFKEFEILKYLLENKNRAIAREELLEKVWGYKYLGETRTVDIHIKSIRKKLSRADYIKTIRGFGYKISNQE